MKREKRKEKREKKSASCFSRVFNHRSLIFYLLSFIFLLLTGCVNQYKVVVGFSPELRGFFIEYPTIEVDIAAVTDDEKDQVKQMGVEEYFAPGSSMRQQLQSQTCFFYREEPYTYVLPSRAPTWLAWREKKPKNIMVIASLPYDPSMSPQSDPRYLSVTMKKSFIIARTLYIMVEPRRIVQVAKAKTLKQESTSGTNSSLPVNEQWVESRNRNRNRRN